MKKARPLLFRKMTRFSLLTGAVLLLSYQPVSAFVLDNFNSKSGWVDTLNGGTASVSSGQFIITTATGNNALTASLKTSSPTTAALGTTFTPTVNHTLELLVDANSAFNASQDTNALAVLAWVPTGGSVLANGYALVVGADSVLVQKGGVALFSTNGIALNNTNVTLALRITPSGGTVAINVRVYRQITPGSSAQYLTALFEYTVTDPSANLVGVTGNVGLGVKNIANPAGSSVSYDNLQVFDIINSVLDDFNSNTPLTPAWAPFVKHSGGPDFVTKANGTVEFLAGPDPTAGFAGMYYAAQSFVIQDGGRLQFSIECTNNNTGLHSYTVLGFVPATGSAAISDLFQLIEYHIAADPGNVYNGKAYNNWWGGPPDPIPGPYPSSNFRLTITFTGEGTNCRIESRAEDLSKDVNDPTRIYYQNMRIDTINQDANEASGLKLPFIGVPGSFAIDTFGDSAVNADIVIDNARVNQTIPPNLPPLVNNLSPALGSNFRDPTNHITFDVSDEVNVVSNGITVTLNGVVYTNGSPGVTVTPASGTAASRHVDISGVLSPNVYYAGTISAKDAQNATSVNPLSFDTFQTNILVVECEEFNFSSDNGITGGSYIDNPTTGAQGTSGNPLAYNGVTGIPEIDFHDNRGQPASFDPNHDFRLDAPYNIRSGDLTRSKYSNLGPSGDGGYNEEQIDDIRDGDWLNYTHNYPAGAYNVYLRQAQYLIPVSLVTLDLVSGDTTTNTAQTTSTLGSFLGTVSGTGQFRDVPLSDGLGNPIPLKLSGGLTTLRLSERITGNANSSVGILEQNYLAFVPTADPGTLRPIVSSASPLAGTAVIPNPGSGGTSSSPTTSASIANRDTSVNVGSIVLKMNGNPVTANVTAVPGGAQLTWSPSVLPPTANITNTLSFVDSDGTNVSYSWTYSYPFLRASNSIPANSLNLRGFEVRTVQSASVGAAGNSLATAEQQLAYPPEITPDIQATNVVQELFWNDDTCTPSCVPGLDTPGHDNIATESFGYMYLTAGAHRFFVSSDDGFQMRSGSSFRDKGGVVVGARDGGTFGGTFDFIVEADGLYPVRFLWYEHGGGASLQLSSVNLADSTQTVVNDPADPAGVVKVYYPARCLSSAGVAGPFATEASAVFSAVTPTSGTVTIPQSGLARFYRIDTVRSTKITSVTRSGGNIVLTYQAQ